MGDAKIKIKNIWKTAGRNVTYSKRRDELLKKANELSELRDADIVVTFSRAGKVVKVLQRFVDTSPQERTLKRDENLKKLATIVTNFNAEKEGEDGSADGEPRPEEDSELVAKQREIEHLGRRLMQAQPQLLEGVIWDSIKQMLLHCGAGSPGGARQE